ncbi:MAG: proton-conducting transporter membrane subunit [Coriobacteriia bacterium]|nr:proton-conducting transporter membrane subunit [Coriobacteriia bacterium]
MKYLISYGPAGLGVLGAIVSMALDAFGLRRSAIWAAAVGLLAGGGLAIWALSYREVILESVIGGPLASMPPAACLLLGAVALAGGSGLLGSEPGGARVAALGALASSAAAIAAASFDLMILFIAIETLALCGYGLVALAGTDEAREAAMKWFVQGSVATALLIGGLAVLLGITGGSLFYVDILAASEKTGASAALAVGLTLVVSGIAFKAAAFPFHSWAPDAYQHAGPVSAALLSSSAKVGALAAAGWLAVIATGSAPAALSQWAFAAIAVGSIVFGNLAALRQRSFARMLAYSGVAQVGYAFAVMATRDDSITTVGKGLRAIPVLGENMLAAVMVFAVLYGLSALAAFMFAAAIRESDPAWDGSISALAGLSSRRPALAISLAVVMFALTGMPLTAGFWGKFLVFGTAAAGGWAWLAIVGVLGSVVSFGYYGSVLRAAFFDDSAEPVSGMTPGGPAAKTTVALAVLIVVVGILPLAVGVTPLLAGMLGGQ